jgi:hypothetical protein
VSAHAPLSERARAVLFANGLGLIVAAVVVGWAWFFHLLGEIVLWPIPASLDVQIPGDSRAFRMAHMEGITHGLLLMALAFGGRFLLLSPRGERWFVRSALVTAWLFTVPAMLHPLFGTRGLAFGGGPFKPGLANDALYLLGWPPVIAVHVMLAFALTGVLRFLRARSA